MSMLFLIIIQPGEADITVPISWARIQVPERSKNMIWN